MWGMVMNEYLGVVVVLLAGGVTIALIVTAIEVAVAVCRGHR